MKAGLDRAAVAKADAQQAEVDKAVEKLQKESVTAAMLEEDTDPVDAPSSKGTAGQKPLKKAGNVALEDGDDDDDDDDDEDESDEKDKMKAPPEVVKDGGAPARKKGDKWDTGKEGGEKEVKPKTVEEKQTEAELNAILKRSPSEFSADLLLSRQEHSTQADQRDPVIIFSKTYCPHSQRAKHILLEKYSIVPAPFVVELDEHEFGPALQAKLADMTGRKTVPNVLISGKSIGGGDDVAELHETGKLGERIRAWGGKRVQEVKLRDS